MATVKKQITMNEDVFSRIEKFVKENYLTFSGFVQLAAMQYLNQHEATLAVKGIALSLRTIAEKGSVTPEQMAEMENYARAIDVIWGGE